MADAGHAEAASHSLLWLLLVGHVGRETPHATSILLLFTYVELIDKATYLNHYYLVSLLSFLMIFMPLHQMASLDAWRKRPPRDAIPAWMIWTLRAQVGVVYVFGGIAKLNPDWLLQAQPPRIWLLFPIGMFPWIMIVTATIFFPSDWPRRPWAWRRGGVPHRRLLPEPASPPTWRWHAAAVGLAIYALARIALPMRHWAYPGDVRWNEEGYRFAWRVMLTEKTGRPGFGFPTRWQDRSGPRTPRSISRRSGRSTSAALKGPSMASIAARQAAK